MSDWADDTEARPLTGGVSDWSDDEEPPYASPIQAGGGSDWTDDQEPPASAPPTPLPVGTFDFPDDQATPARYALAVSTDWEDDTPKPYLLSVVADAYAYCKRSTAQTLTSGVSDRLAFEDFWTNDGTVFATSTDGSTVSNASGDSFLLLQQVGFYLFASEVHWSSGGNYNRFALIDADSVLGFGPNEHPDSSTATQLAADGVGELWDRDVKPLAFAAAGGLPGSAFIRAFQNSGVNKNVDIGVLIAFYVPMTVDTTSDQVY